MAIQTLMQKPGFRPLDRIQVEMNLLEFPIASYSRRYAKAQGSLVVRRDAGDGKVFKWEVVAGASLGLPVPEDLDHFLVLLHEGNKHMDTGPQYHFSFWKWALALDLDPTSGHVLQGLHRTLRRLVASTVFAEGSWWDADSGQRVSIERPFHLLESYELFKRIKRPGQIDLQLNWVRLSQPFFSSIKSGYLRSIDFGFYKLLPSHLSKQLYLHLAKMMGRKPDFEYGLETLRANIAYPLDGHNPDRTYREMLAALTLLGERGFLGEMRVAGRGGKAVLVLGQGSPQVMRASTAAERTGIQLSLLGT